jgi:phosphatidylserine decarboxylase
LSPQPFQEAQPAELQRVGAAPSTSWLRTLWREDLNFLLTNRIPRRWATLFMGWFSQLEQPLVRDASIAVWRWFAPDLDLSEARKTSFKSVHDCFVRELKPGARPTDRRAEIVTSPCDAIVGAHGVIEDGKLYQAKGFDYTLEDLIGDRELARRHRGGKFVTLRIKSSFYHRFHAPCDGRLDEVNYISGDTWNVNPIALARIERLFCRNERAAIELRLSRGGHRVTLVPIAAILVASIRLHFADLRLHVDYDGPETIVCDARLRKGEEMGWFEHGSTIVVFAPEGFEPCEGVATGRRIRMGEPLLRCADAGPIG